MRQDWGSQALTYAAKQVFKSTHSSDRSLRGIVATKIDQHRELINYEETQHLLDSGSGMAWVLVQVLLAAHVNQD